MPTYQPKVFQRYSYKMWEDSGRKDVFELAKERVTSLQESYQKPDILDASVLRDLENYMNKKSEAQGT